MLLIHQLPPKPTNLRVRIWRKLQKLGAVAIKNSVYVLPANEKTHEDFQWLKQEIESAGGEATVFQAASVEGTTDKEITAAFRKARDEEFAAIAAELDGLAGAASDDWLRTNPNWISCTRNWRALSLTISSRLVGAHARLRLMTVARKRFVPRTVSPRKRHAPKRELERWIWLTTRVVVG